MKSHRISRSYYVTIEATDRLKRHAMFIGVSMSKLIEEFALSLPSYELKVRREKADEG